MGAKWPKWNRAVKSPHLVIIQFMRSYFLCLFIVFFSFFFLCVIYCWCLTVNVVVCSSSMLLLYIVWNGMAHGTCTQFYYRNRNGICEWGILTIHRDNWLVALIDIHHVRIAPSHRRQLLGMVDGPVCTIPTSAHRTPKCRMLRRTFCVADIPETAIWLDDSRCHQGNCNRWGRGLWLTSYRPILHAADRQYCVRWRKGGNKEKQDKRMSIIALWADRQHHLRLLANLSTFISLLYKYLQLQQFIYVWALGMNFAENR